MDNIVDLIRKKENVAFFVGSGISFDYPSILPGWTLVSEGPIRFLYSEKLKKNQDEIVFHSKKLRPEVLIDIMYRVIGDKSIEWLKILKSKEYNINHLFLASIILKYNIPVITTNYDELIETASKDVFKKPPRTYCNEVGFNKWKRLRDKPPCLIKLHGTIRNVESIKAFLQQVAGEPSKLMKNILKYYFENYTVIFWGYSLTDDFDIVPILKEVTPTHIIRLRYRRDNDKIIKTSLKENEKELGSKLDKLMFEEPPKKERENILKIISRLRSEVNFGRLATHAKTFSVYFHSSQVPIIIWNKLKKEEKKKKYDEFYLKWSKTIDDADKLLIGAEILFYVQDKKETFQKVVNLCSNCISILEKKSRYDIERLSNAHLLKGWAHRMIGSDEDLNHAIKNFNKALNLLKAPKSQKLKERKSYILHQMGQSFHRKWRASKKKTDLLHALKNLNASLKIREHSGIVSDIAYTKFQIFYIKDETGEYIDGYPIRVIKPLKKLLCDAQEYLSKTGDVKGAAIMVHNKAYINQLIGTKKFNDKDYDKSIRLLKVAIKLYQYSIENRNLIFDTGGITMANLRLTDCYVKIVKISINNKKLNRAKKERDSAEKYLKNAKKGYVRMKKEPYRQENVRELEKEIEKINLLLK